jgi:rfaE bifunctional protein nucleotidyltransferase chain/domain
MHRQVNTLQDFFSKKTVAPERLAELSKSLKRQNRTIATLNGSFDLLHAGHLYILFEAAKTADVLIVALNTDASVKSYKGPTRPLISLSYRLQMIAALEFVDYVTWFDEPDPRNILQIIEPHVHVNGIEYGENCIEAPVVKSMGAKMHLVDRIPGLATSEIITKIKSACV